LGKTVPMEPAVLTRATERPEASADQKDRRLRTVYRRELQEGVFFSALLATSVIAVATGIMCVVTPAIAVGVVALNLPLVVAGLVIANLSRRRGRRYIVPLGMILGLLPIVSSLDSIVLSPSYEPLVLATLGLIPLAFAIFLPLQRRQHLTWLVAANLLFFGGFVAAGLGDSWKNDLTALAASAGLSSALSLGANEVQLRRRRQMSRQLLAVRGLYGRMKEHELDLRRQDEFLFMQQETLVVQQAELLRLNEELEGIARLDTLTGLGNRLRLNEDLAQIAGRIERNGGTAGLLLMDLDRFKRLNDTLGHLAGDAALRGVAAVLKHTSRVGDGLYRYCGEEFLIILHDADESVLKVAGQRYLTAIQAAGMQHGDNEPWGVVTASAGATELSQRNCMDIDGVLHLADEALYRAKDRGRNRCEVMILEAPVIVPMDQERAAS
jgi:diguanylate cyclase (GGDEF)-like protein